MLWMNVADIGGTKTSFAQMLDDDIRWVVEVPTPEVKSLRSFGEWMCQQWTALAPMNQQIQPARFIGISTTGVVNPEGISSLNPKTLRWPDPFPLRQAIEDMSGLTTWVLNDAQAAAWAEYQAIKKIHPATHRMMYVTISTGLGAGLVLDGQLLQSPKGLAGHAGHMAIQSSGPLCGCGRTGCIESLSSGRALQEQIHQMGLELSVQEAYRKRNEPALNELFKQAAAHIAQAITNVHALLELDRVVIGGGLGLQSDFFQWICHAIDHQPAWAQVSLLPAVCGRNSCLQGAGNWTRAQLAKAHTAPIFQK